MCNIHNNAQDDDIIIHGRPITVYGNYSFTPMIITILENKTLVLVNKESSMRKRAKS